MNKDFQEYKKDTKRQNKSGKTPEETDGQLK